MRKPLIILVAIVLGLVGLMVVARLIGPEDTWICVDHQWVKHGNPSSLPPASGCGETGQTVKLYYYDPRLDTDASGNILCSQKGLVPTDRILPQTTTPIEDTIKLLLRGGILPEGQAQSQFPLAGVALTGTDLKQGVLTLTFDDPQNRTSGVSCRAGILWAQIEATAKQFPGVNTVRFMPESLFQP